MTLNHVTLKSGDSQLMLNASLDNYSNPRLHAKYVMMLATGDFRRVLNNPSLPVGMVLVNGFADYASVAGRAPLDTASLEGTVRSSVLRVNTPNVRTDVRDLAASYHLVNGNAELHNISARLLGGVVNGDAVVKDLSGRQQGQVNLRAAQHLDVRASGRRSPTPQRWKPVAVTGRINANARQGSWTGASQQSHSPHWTRPQECQYRFGEAERRAGQSSGECRRACALQLRDAGDRAQSELRSHAADFC